MADGLITRESQNDPQTTMDLLVAETHARGLRVFARIDHAAGAAQVALALRRPSC